MAQTCPDWDEKRLLSSMVMLRLTFRATDCRNFAVFKNNRRMNPLMQPPFMIYLESQQIFLLLWDCSVSQCLPLTSLQWRSLYRCFPCPKDHPRFYLRNWKSMLTLVTVMQPQNVANSGCGRALVGQWNIVVIWTCRCSLDAGQQVRY